MIKIYLYILILFYFLNTSKFNKQHLYIHKGGIKENNLTNDIKKSIDNNLNIEIDIFYDNSINDFIISHDDYKLQNVDSIDIILKYANNKNIYFWFDLKNLHKSDVFKIYRKLIYYQNKYNFNYFIESLCIYKLNILSLLGIKTSFWISNNYEFIYISFSNYYSMNYELYLNNKFFIDNFVKKPIILFTVNNKKIYKFNNSNIKYICYN